MITFEQYQRKRKMIIRLIPILLALVTTTVHANLITFNGSDLINNASVSFPNESPSLIGDSLVFGPGGAAYEYLLVLPLFTAGSEISTPLEFSLSFNFTRISCTNTSTCLGNELDYDPHIMLSDGSNLIGAVIADNNNGEALAATLQDGGNVGFNRSLSSIYTNAEFPGISESVDININFLIDDTFTQMEVSFLMGTGSYMFPIALDTNFDINLVILRDNDIGEQYQLNSISIPVSVSEPPTLLLLLIGIFGIAGQSILAKIRRRTITLNCIPNNSGLPAITIDNNLITPVNRLLRFFYHDNEYISAKYISWKLNVTAQENSCTL